LVPDRSDEKATLVASGENTAAVSERAQPARLTDEASIGDRCQIDKANPDIELFR
jgi:hypothetical protein